MENFTNSLALNVAAQNKNIPVSDSREPFADNKKEQKSVIKYIYVYRNIEKPAKTDDSDNLNFSQNPASIDFSKIEGKNPLSGNNSELESQFIENPGIKAINQNEIYDLSKIPAHSGFSFEFGSSVNWNIPQETLFPSEMNRFNNLAVTVLYELNDLIIVGANVKQETFFTEYSGTEDIGSIFNYRQHPNLTTFSAVVRTNPFGYDMFRPYLQAAIGANESGFVLRPQIGLEIQTNNNLSFVFGIDYSYFRFIHQNSWFNSGKAGINYGILYKF
jgi:hypothetical protein